MPYSPIENIIASAAYSNPITPGSLYITPLASLRDGEYALMGDTEYSVLSSNCFLFEKNDAASSGRPYITLAGLSGSPAFKPAGIQCTGGEGCFSQHYDGGFPGILPEEACPSWADVAMYFMENGSPCMWIVVCNPDNPAAQGATMEDCDLRIMPLSQVPTGTLFPYVDQYGNLQFDVKQENIPIEYFSGKRTYLCNVPTACTCPNILTPPLPAGWYSCANNFRPMFAVSWLGGKCTYNWGDLIPSSEYILSALATGNYSDCDSFPGPTMTNQYTSKVKIIGSKNGVGSTIHFHLDADYGITAYNGDIELGVETDLNTHWGGLWNARISSLGDADININDVLFYNPNYTG